MEKNKLSLGERIRQLRESEGISQGELSSIVQISRSAISQIEGGERKVAADELVLIAKRFNISMENLIHPENGPRVELPKKSISNPAVGKEI